MKEFLPYAAKASVALVAALAILATAVADNVVTPAEWIQVAIAALGALGVYYVPNKPVVK